MIKLPANSKPVDTAKTAKKTWVAPRLEKIDAGQAEVSTRTASDGAFTTS